ncbi:MAG TPA: phosphate-starvation-inducible PsiE family protein [Acidimicrobiales bacterium]|nr:phosphate-starvation-inducible PsiE family protein [Acidimicrobiales bacterium]
MATDTEPDQPAVQPIDRILGTAENLTYAAAGALLLVSALAVLATVAYHLATDLTKGAEQAVTTALDGLLLVFIVLELLAGVRATIIERKLVAEPFLVVGIIASIKEIVVIALEVKTADGLDDPGFQASMAEIGVLGLLVLTLAAAGYLVRRKEREPTEGDVR